MRTSIASAVLRFAIAGLVAMVALAAVAIVVLGQLGENEAIDDARRVAGLAGRGIVEPALTDAALAGDPVALARLDRLVQTRVLDADIIRVKIWTRDGRIAYSDEPRLIGRRYGLDEEKRAAVAAGRTEAELSDLSGPENAFERGEGSLLEVYLPIRSSGGQPALFELYQRQSAVEASGRRLLRALAPVVGGGLLLLWLITLPLAWSLARRLRDGARERQRLLEAALESSALERRRIAADLHDGPVQDLAGLAFSLAAAAESAPAGTDERTVGALRAGAGAARDGTRRLRSSVVEINPGRLRDAGLAASIADLAAPLRAAGVVVEDDVPADLVLASHVEELLYRAAAEGLRNVAAHAGAGRVRVGAEIDRSLARLVVTDDGRGFSEATRERRRADGHLGLVLIEDLAGHLGGSVRVESAPGRGTTLTVEVPA